MDRQLRIWKPLDVLKEQIRVLVLSPDSNGRAVLKGRLEIVSLFHRPHYDAISWAWSRAECSYPIILGNDELLIPESLVCCLRRFRHTTEERRLWADVICISQHDEKERAQQVQIMHRIFYGAMTVRAWLGHGCEDSQHGMEVLATASSQNTHLPKDPSHSDFHAMAALGTARYWSRLWPVSEQVLAANLTLHYGGYSLSRDQFGAAFRKLEDVQSYLVRISPDTVLFRNVDRMRLSITRLVRRLKLLETCLPKSTLHKAMALLSLFYSGREQEVSDDKDRVYGLLGVCVALLGDLVAVDYTSSTRDVYIDFARHFMKRTGSLVILNQATPHKNTLSKLPSWVPDWSSHYMHQQEIDIIELWGVFNACGSIRVPQPPMNFDGNDLILSAVFSDVVADVGDPYHWSTHSSSNTVLDWHTLYMQHRAADNGAFARTLCRGVSKFVWSEQVLPDIRPLEPGEAESRLQSVLKHWSDFGYPSDKTPESVNLLRDMIFDYRFFMTQNGQPGLGPTSTQPGDVVVLALGANLPLLLRPTDRGAERVWTFVGEIYVDGIMYGDAVSGMSEHDFQQMTIQ